MEKEKKNNELEKDDFKVSIISITTLIVTTILIGIAVIILRNNYLKDYGKKGIVSVPITDGVEVYPTMLDNIVSDSIWCPTFELVWQDMLNEEVGSDGSIYFKPTILISDNLNKRYFKEEDLSDEYYYKIYGPKTIKLKQQIEKGIKEKFNQTSDILDKFSWDEKELDGSDINARRLFFYTMLYREFEFPYVFDKLDDDKFKEYEGIKFFGIDEDTDEKVRENIRVMFYDDKDNFAIKLTTKNNDEVILYKNPKGENFKEIYDSLNSKSETYDINHLSNREFVSIPYLKINVEREFDEFSNKPFYDIDDNELGTIIKAIQSIQFEIDEKGGKVKSEAAIDMRENSIHILPEETRIFKLNDTFALFLKEQDKEKPYLALKVDDIRKYQSEVK